MVNILKLIAILLYCAITLNGEYGVPVILHILFSLFSVHLFDKIHALCVLVGLIFMVYSIFKPTLRSAVTKFVVVGLVLVTFLIRYTNQPQEHDSPLDFGKSFIWMSIAFVCIFIIIVIQVIKKNNGKISTKSMTR